MANFRKMGLRTLHEITDHFKTVARLLIEHSYEIWVPIWETGDPYLVHKVDELLVGWTFTDAPMLVSNRSILQTDSDILNRSKTNTWSAYSTTLRSQVL